VSTTSACFTILGAGLAGLSAAWHLTRRGVPVRVFEREGRVGGMAVTLQRDGYRFDLGPHRFHTRNQTVLRMVQELLGDELLVHQRLSRIRLNGRFLDYPPNLPSLVRSMEPATSLRCLLDYFNAFWQRRVHQSEEPDFQSWVTGRFGQHLYDIYFGPYTHKVWGTSPHLLSAELARRRITVPNLADVLLRLVISSKNDPGPYVTQFWYPKAGIGRIAERLAEEVTARQGEVCLSHTVETVHLSADRVVGLTLNHEGERRHVPCEWVLSTLPLPYLIRCMDPPVDEKVRQAAALPYRALIFVFIMLDKPQVGQEHWLYFPEECFSFNRVSEPRNFSPTHAPADKTSLCAEITCDVGDVAWHMPPEVLAKQVIDDLAEARLVDPAQVEGFFTQRIPWGYPIYEMGYESRLKLLLDFVGRIENLITFGRQGGFDYSDMAEAIASGLAAAEASSLFLVKRGRALANLLVTQES
jgi:protoporphyrinogen oxidase